MKAILAILIFITFAGSCYAEVVEYKLGITVPLSGRLAYVGKDIQRGVELAIKDLSSEALKFKTVYEDNQHEARLAASGAKKLLSIDDVDVLISLWDMADVVALLAEQSRVPHIAIRWNPHISEKYSYTLTIESTYKSYIDKLLELLKSLEIRSAGIFTEEGKGWILASDYLKQKAPDAGLVIVGDERYPNDFNDHRGLVLRLLKNKPEMIVLLSNPPHTEILVKRIKEASPAQRFTGYFEYTESPELFDGVPFVSQFKAAPWFEDKFRKEFNAEYKARAPQAYDIVKLITLAQNEQENKLTGKELIASVSSIQNADGASGRLSVSGSRNIESECVWKVFEEGKLKLYRENG